MAERKAAVIGIFAAGEGAAVPSDQQEIRKELRRIIEQYDSGEILSDEDKAIVTTYIPAIGVDEWSTTPEGSIIGKGAYEIETSDLGLTFKATGEMGCTYYGESRIEHYSNMKVEKTEGDTPILGYKFFTRFVSFGMGPQGKMKVLFDREFERSFPGGETAAYCMLDRSTFIQWGFYHVTRCEVSTPDGTITIS